MILKKTKQNDDLFYTQRLKIKYQSIRLQNAKIILCIFFNSKLNTITNSTLIF